MKTPVVLIDDPGTNDEYDLKRPLADWSHGLRAVIEPVAVEPASPGGVPTSLGKSDSDTTRGLKTARVRYRVTGKGEAQREFEVSQGPEVLRQLGSPLLVVCFVSARTFPLVVALAQHDATRDFLRVGVTGVRMDTGYNLARKLILDGHIAYHEHTRVLEKVLCRRLELMLAAHAERWRTTPR